MSDTRFPHPQRNAIIAAALAVLALATDQARSQTPTPSPSPSNADLALTVVVDKDPVPVGSNRVYTATVVNNGPADVTNVTFQATLPQREIFQTAFCDGSCSVQIFPSSQSVTVTLFGTMSLGTSRRISITVQVQTRFSGTFTGSVSSNTSDPNQQNNTASYTTSGPPPATAKLLNISTRLAVQTGDNVLIAGFILIRGNKHIAVRALGPSLASAGVTGALSDPTLELHVSGFGLVGSNDNWRDSSSSSELQSLGLAPADDRESALIASLSGSSSSGNPSGQQACTAVEGGRNNSTGVGLVEVYDLDRFEDARFGNISTRGFVGVGDNVMIGGFILGGGNGTGALLVRAIGPSLSDIPTRLADPILELHDGQGSQIAVNDNWKDQQEADIRSTGIPPSNDLESAILVTLPSGNYTAILRGTNGGTGIALVEAYSLQ